jgi:translation initiation factor 3 subunit H
MSIAKAAAAAGSSKPTGPISDLDAAALELIESSKQPVTSVRLDGLAFTKIIKHSRDAHPNSAPGALLGLEIGGALEVSNVFPLPANALGSASRDRNEEEGESHVGRSVARYTNSMLTLLREVNADANPVGLYLGCFLGSFMSQPLIDGLWATSTLMERGGSEEKGRAILLVHDLAQSAQGNAAIRAFKLAPSFIDAYRRGKFHTQR